MGAPIREELVLADSFSQTFRNFDAAANAAINVAEEFQKTLNEFSEGFLDGLVNSLQDSRDELGRMASEADDVKDAYKGVEDIIRKTTGGINDNTDAQDKFKDSIKDSEREAKSLMGTVSKIAGAIGVVKLAENFIETADEMAQINAKLNLINDGFQTTEELQQKIFESAQRTRSSYQDTAQLIARIGMNTGDTFKSNAEMVKFAENLNKSFKIAGASAQEQSSVILQLSQALAGGLLRGQEFNAVMSGAPNIIKNIADYMGVTVGQMRDLAAEGQITSDIIREAMLGATDTINGQFETLPRTFGDVMTTAKNQITTSLNGAFEEWISKLNDGDIQATIDKITNAITTLATVGADALLKIVDAITWIIENFEKIEPVLVTVGTAIVTFKVLNIKSAEESATAWGKVGEAIARVKDSSLGIAILTGLSINQAERQREFEDNSLNYIASKSGYDNYNDYLTALDKEKHNVSTAPVLGRVSNLDTGIYANDFYNMYYGSRYTPDDEGFKKSLQGIRQKNTADWYNSYYGRDTGYHIPEESWKAVEDIKDNGVKIKGEVKLSDEDLQIFRDIAENRYIANVSLETLAPSVSVNVENNGQNLSEDDIATAVTRAIETQISERTAISHG